MLGHYCACDCAIAPNCVDSSGGSDGGLFFLKQGLICNDELVFV